MKERTIKLFPGSMLTEHILMLIHTSMKFTFVNRLLSFPFSYSHGMDWKVCQPLPLQSTRRLERKEDNALLD